MATLDFDKGFLNLTDNAPFPWQRELYERFIAERPDNIPSSGSIPTGLGKTSVIAIWLIALANCPQKMPRRLVYVVNRRTVVDQTTDEVEKLRKNLEKAGIKERLQTLCAFPLGKDDQPLAISTLRGQFADNREWSADPCRPAVIAGTVDMIGSRLLFSGYGVGFKGKPLHAGFLGQDVLLIHDEAHLEPAFQELLVAIEKEQKRCGEFQRFRVMELSATSRGKEELIEPFALTAEDHDNPVVRQRISAKKTIHLHKEGKKVADEVTVFASNHRDSGQAVLVFSREVKDVEEIAEKLRKAKQQVETLTGTLRGKERDELVNKPTFQRFLPKSEPSKETAYLVCTSAGEVGVNISADHLVCDLSTFESMAQRFGRVNRFGERDDTRIDIVYPKEFDKKNKLEARREKTLALLGKLNGDGSPTALMNLDPKARQEAFAPTPTILPVTDILFDAWALTTIRDKLPGRPPVEPYLHGLASELPETHVAWREEVWQLRLKFKDEQDRKEREAKERKQLAKFAADLLEDYPLKPHELLRDNSSRVFDRLKQLFERRKKVEGFVNLPVWLVAADGSVFITTLRELVEAGKDSLAYQTVLLPPEAGGLKNGMLASDFDAADDVADQWMNENGKQRRIRVWDDDSERELKTKGMRPVRTVEIRQEDAGDEADTKKWRWFVEPKSADPGWSAPVEQLLDEHLNKAKYFAERFAKALDLPEPLATAVVLAASWHDLGKDRPKWQYAYGNRKYPEKKIAKSGHRRPPVNLERYRHEFGSLADLWEQPKFKEQSDEVRDLILHLIAAHHGRARPHFPAEEAFDPRCRESAATDIAREVPGRYARLQRKYGRWGLAYLESLLRAADIAASANPSASVKEGEQ